jgi:hypothetical protein
MDTVWVVRYCMMPEEYLTNLCRLLSFARGGRKRVHGNKFCNPCIKMVLYRVKQKEVILLLSHLIKEGVEPRAYCIINKENVL